MKRITMATAAAAVFLAAQAAALAQDAAGKKSAGPTGELWGGLVSDYWAPKDEEEGTGWGGMLRVKDAFVPNLDFRTSLIYTSEMEGERRGLETELSLFRVQADFVWLFENREGGVQPHLGVGAAWYLPDFDITASVDPAAEGELDPGIGYHLIAGLTLPMGSGAIFMEFQWRYVRLEASGNVFRDDEEVLDGPAFVLGFAFKF